MTAHKMNTLQRCGLVAVGALIPALLTAQPSGINSRPPEKDAAFLMVPAFTSAERGERGVGAQAADALRSKIGSEISLKQIYVIPIQRLNAQLEASGFSTTEGLKVQDAKALATYVRADFFIDGNAVRSGTTVKVGGDLVLARNVSLRQPLGSFDGQNVNAATGLMAKEIKEAIKQMDGEKKCNSAAREKKYPEAIAAANGAIVLYPKATLARICLAQVLDTSGAPTAEVLKVTQDIIAIDPINNPALRIQASAYRKTKQSDSLVKTLTRWLRTEINNPVLVGQIITEIAGEKNPAIALPIVEEAVAANPGEPDLLKLRWQILSAVKDYKAMIAQGIELVALDTSFADSAYYRRTALAFLADSQPLKSAEVAARGLVKYPMSEVLTGLEIQQLQRAGQQQQALEKLDKAIANKVPVEYAGAIRLGLLRDLNRKEEILPTIKSMIAAGDTTTALRANLFAQLAGDAIAVFNAATTLDDSVAARRKGLELMFYADSVIKSGPQVSETQFRLGDAQLKLANTLYAQSGKLATVPATRAQSCPVIKEAKDHAVEAQILLPKGGAFNAEATGTYLKFLAQLNPAIDNLITQLKCN